MATRPASAPAASASIAHCATARPSPRTAQRIELHINAGLLMDVPHLGESGADGIGLFRTELQFMISATLAAARAPDPDVPRRGGRRPASKPVVFRTLDVGGDKVLPYLRQPQEENPALGWRAIRLGLDRPGLLRTQVRALLQGDRRAGAAAAAADGDRPSARSTWRAR